MSFAKNKYPGDPEAKPEFDIYDGTHGFHWTRDEELSGILTHGLLSRRVKMDRDMRIGKASRAPATWIYFSTNPRELYLSTLFEDQRSFSGDPHQSKVDHSVAIVVSRPEYARTSEGHFVYEMIVERDDIEALLFVDQKAVQAVPGGIGKPGGATHDFIGMEEPDKVETKLALLRNACDQAGLDIPICGISGEPYYNPALSAVNE